MTEKDPLVKSIDDDYCINCVSFIRDSCVCKNKQGEDQDPKGWCSQYKLDKKRPFIDVEKGESKIPSIASIKAKENFHSPELMLHTHSRLSETHLKDDAVKMMGFFVCLTSELKNPRHRQSIALKGNRSVGKDNLIKTWLSNLPEEGNLFLTSATKATMQDSLKDSKRVACSEVNLQKDDRGANSDLVEVLKQITEGGTSIMKKERAEGKDWVTVRIEQEQKSVIYGTTESDDDDELNTRFIIGSVQGNREKTDAVNRRTMDEFAGGVFTEKLSWISEGIKELCKVGDIVMPYLKHIPESFFNNEDSRSMRDVKRFLSVVKGIAYYHQCQRKVDKEGRIISEPFDFLAGMIISRSFFNHTYQGMGDQRIHHFIDAMNKYCDSRPTLSEEEKNIFPRHEIQNIMGVSLNTIKGISKGCQSLSIIRFHHKDNVGIYYLRCQKGVKRVLMGVNHKELRDILFKKGGVKIPQREREILEKLDKTCNSASLSHFSDEIDTPTLTPQAKVEEESI